MKIMRDKRIQVPFRMEQSKLKEMDLHIELSNARNRNDFINEAIEFYIGYLQSGSNAYLPIAFDSQLKGSLKITEDRLSKLLFKNAVEMSMMMNILAANTDVDDETLNKLRAKCVKDVKYSNGKISIEDINRYQRD